ncbi:recombinase family protein [Bacillus cereus group sp. MYBK249-1]|uniref:recombinase family protein n=1 Tax=Bacillus cereus group TaxID=86661 RepID=UPI000A3A79F4|nr:MULTISPECIES: recombinase family protein [Bacillus cereus group]MED3068672.1 recombinase family protein [Bacillus thuringiensis]MCU5121290.1 recombinase family protein [Bacillus cereus]OUB30466.1 integrase [Bacillus thuringiensis serovar palmanyolensis]PFF36780.1 integrase [Bacillus cereus]WPA85874.1 recombinase family protein [Bacillus cereus]
MKTFGYIRVSSKDQKEDRQIKKMLAKGIDERDLFIDKVSGKDFERPRYQILKQMVREGDMVVFDSITRMGRNMNDTMKEYEWFVENGVNLCFIEEPMIDTNNESDDVMKQAIQKIILTMLTAFAEKERKEIKARQAEGIAVAKEQGVKFGRPSIKIPSNWDKNYKEWKSGNITAQKFAQNVDMSIATFYRKLKQYEQDKKEKVC